MSALEEVEISWDGTTHPSHHRKNNEDAFLALALNSEEFYYLGKTGSAPLSENDFIFAVADGMGGEKSGEYASRIAVDKITQIIPRYFRRKTNGEAAGFEEAFKKVFEDTHNALSYLGGSYPECSNMGSTLSMLWITPEDVRFAHIGDSRIYKQNDSNPVEQISHDHTHVGYLLRTGAISEREARTHPRRNALQRALGAGQQIINPQMGFCKLSKDDRYLLCSDGLVDGLWDKHITRVLNESGADDDKNISKAEALVHEAVNGSSTDNTTALLVSMK